ncbi:MAG: ABC transporter permease [Phycisphaerales bacterium]|nr:ABC transporter permease [Phycisphaerales bacterium]
MKKRFVTTPTLDDLLYPVGLYLHMFDDIFSKPENKKMFWKELVAQLYDISIGALPIVIIISFFVGAVTTVQTAYQLVSPFISRAYISLIVRDSLVLELAPTLISIVLAGVIGSKITSELGNMRISEQIDALEIMGINSRNYLILPKIIACVAIFPLMIIIAIFVGLLGGRIAGSISGLVPVQMYDSGLLMNFDAFTIFFSLIKAVSYAFIISSLSSCFGYYAEGGALEIGIASTRAVVFCSVAILIADFIITTFLV